MDTNKGNRTERKKEETKRKIIAVAMDLFNKQGFVQTTVEQIAEGADVAKMTVYNHFPVKEAIISEYIEREMEERGPEVIRSLLESTDTRSRLITLIRMSLEWIEVEFNKDLYKRFFAYQMQTMEQSIKDSSLRDGFHSILVHIIGLGQEMGEIRKDIPTKVLARQFESMYVITIAAWLAIPESFPVYERMAWNVALFLNGAINRENKK